MKVQNKRLLDAAEILIEAIEAGSEPAENFILALAKIIHVIQVRRQDEKSVQLAFQAIRKALSK